MSVLDRFDEVKVLVVGDVMLDRYWWGDVQRISPEAPVPVVKLNRSSHAAGGAANVAVNIAGLGANPLLLGAVGVDHDAEILAKHIAELGVSAEYLTSVDGRPTTVKTRVIAHNQQVARVDQEVTSSLDKKSEESMLNHFRTLVGAVNSVVLSDYSKGVLTDRLVSEFIALAHSAGKSVLVDPKGKDFSRYRRATILTPNRGEAANACNFEADMERLVESAGKTLLKSLDVSAVLITEGDEGMTLFEHGHDPKHFPAAARNVYDVTGAGDTVIATLATALGAGADLETATRLANAAAGLVVEHVGTAAVKLDELRAAADVLH